MRTMLFLIALAVFPAFAQKPNAPHLTTGTQISYYGIPKAKIPVADILFKVHEQNWRQMVAVDSKFKKYDLAALRKEYESFKKKAIAELTAMFKQTMKVDDLTEFNTLADGAAEYIAMFTMHKINTHYTGDFTETASVIDALQMRGMDCDIGALLLADFVSELFPQTPIFLVYSREHLSVAFARESFFETKGDERLKHLTVFETNFVEKKGEARGYTFTKLTTLNQNVRGTLYTTPAHRMISRIQQIDERVVRAEGHAQLLTFLSPLRNSEAVLTQKAQLARSALASFPEQPIALITKLSLMDIGKGNFPAGTMHEVFRQFLATNAGYSPLNLYEFGIRADDKDALKQAIALHKAISTDKLAVEDRETLIKRGFMLSTKSLADATKRLSK